MLKRRSAVSRGGLLHHVGHQGSPHTGGGALDLLRRLQGIHKNHVGPGVPAGGGPLTGVVKACDGHGVGPGNQHGVRVPPGVDGGPDFRRHLIPGNQLPALHVAAALGPWSSSWMPAAPAASNSDTVRTTFRHSRCPRLR